jgi:hypothetical protein
MDLGEQRLNAVIEGEKIGKFLSILVILMKI